MSHSIQTNFLPPAIPGAMLAVAPRRAAREGMLEAIADAVRTPLAGRDGTVAAALAPFLSDPDLLAGIACPCTKERYARHLLFAGEGYAVLAIVWRPGQMSPVHGHRTWCAFGLHSGILAETLFAVSEGGLPRPFSCIQRRPGDVNHAPADPNAIHRLANLGTEEAVSIHVYGASFDSIGQGVNEVWAD
jgi:predicted metal-dependent enzyme (double-stranded beta helix superfamily)